MLDLEGQRFTNLLEVEKVAFITRCFQQLPSFIGRLRRSVTPVHHAVVLALNAGMAFLQAIFTGRWRLLRTIFGNVPFLVALLAGSGLNTRVNAIGLAVTRRLLVRDYFC